MFSFTPESLPCRAKILVAWFITDMSEDLLLCRAVCTLFFKIIWVACTKIFAKSVECFLSLTRRRRRISVV